MANRRSIIFFVLVAVFLGAILLASRRLSGDCPDGTYCVGGFMPKMPSVTDQDDLLPPGSGPERYENGSQAALDDACANFPDTSNILVIMKTGASESYSKIPTQVITNLRCKEDFLIFSDMAQEIAGYTIYDSLDNVLPEIKNNNQDFDLYFRQQQCPIDQANCNKNFDVASQGWSLDKYKNVHIAEKTYKLRPDYDWYLFVDADTYVIWPTMVQWLSRINPQEPHYIGSVAMLGGFPFGHGGSGYVVSQAAMSAFLKDKENVANKFDRDASNTCCGDYVFAYALKQDTDLSVVNVWPTINGEKPNTLEYSASQWCHPIVTMHHIGSEEVSDFDAFEQERNFSGPLRIKDIYHRFMEPHLTESRIDWDNGADNDRFLDPTSGLHSAEEIERAKTEGLSELEAKAHESFADCQAACVANEWCFQFRYHRKVCGWHYSFKHGVPTKREDNPDERYLSGWDVAKIRKWVSENDKCGRVEWPTLD